MGKHMALDVLEMMGDGRDHTAPEIARRTGLTQKQAGNVLARLARTGQCARGGRGVYYRPMPVEDRVPGRSNSNHTLEDSTVFVVDTRASESIAYVWGLVLGVHLSADQVELALTIARRLEQEAGTDA